MQFVFKQIVLVSKALPIYIHGIYYSISGDSCKLGVSLCTKLWVFGLFLTHVSGGVFSFTKLVLGSFFNVTKQVVIYQVLGNWTCFPKWRNITILRLYLPGFPSFCDEAGSFLKVAKSESSLCDEVEHVCVNVYKRAPILTTVTTVCQAVFQCTSEVVLHVCF